ncbi:MAG: hypothetical protein Kow00124_14980 [Anaerolineae bacterium]
MADDLQSLGEILRQAREARALSLAEAEVQTRIRAKFLEALEQGDLSVLPSLAHARGFLRNYAQYLHLDADALIADFNALTGAAVRGVTTLTAPPPVRAEPPMTAQPEAGGHETPPAPEPWDGPPVPTTYVPPDRRVGPAAPRSAAAREPAGAAARPPRRERQARQRGGLLQSNLFAGAVLLVGLVAILWWTITQLSKVSIDDLVPTPQQSEILERLAASATLVTATPTFEPTSTPAPDTGPQISDRVVLTINVEQRTWAQIIVDGVVQYQGQAEPNTVIQYEGRQEIMVKTGNGAALRITYNGRDIGLLGERGQVVQRFFTTQGQITPTPTPAPTATNTPVPSPTPSATPNQ